MNELMNLNYLYINDSMELKRVTKHNIADLYEIFSDDKVARYIIPKTHTCMNETEAYYRKIETYDLEGMAIYYGMIYGNEKKLIGFVELHNMNQKNRSTKIGYAVNRNYQGKGMAYNYIHELITSIFRSTGLVRIEASVNPENLLSAQLLTKLGFTREGLLRRYSFNERTNEIEDRLIFSMIREDITFGESYNN